MEQGRPPSDEGRLRCKLKVPAFEQAFECLCNQAVVRQELAVVRQDQAVVKQDQAAMPDMRYRVMVTDGAGHDLEMMTWITHPAPEWLFDERVDNTAAYLKVLSNEFHDTILRGTPWRCLNCNKKATELLSRPFCFVQQGVIANRLVPICQSEECEHAAIVNLNQMGKFLNHEVQSKTGGSLFDCMKMVHPRACGNCGVVASVKKCQRCEQIAYCSKECQKFDWKRHKQECKPIAA